MTFLSLILKNLWRHKTRTALTMLGVSIGIATIIALGAVADGLRDSMSGMIGTGKADFVFAQANVSDFVISAIDEQRLDDVRALPGVASVDGCLLSAVQVGNNPMFMLFGLTPAGAELNGVRTYEGRMFQLDADEAMLGKLAAGAQKKAVGDSIDILGRSFRIVGLFQTGDTMQDGAALIPLGRLQELCKRDGKVTMGFVRVTPGTDVKQLTATIDNRFRDELVTISSVDEISRVEKSTQAIDAGTWAISALAIVIGGIGVMNTMIVSVYDRVREIGVLKALGWRSGSIVRMILGEAALVGVAAIGAGTLIALAVLQVVRALPFVNSLLTPAYSAGLWLRATVVSLLVSLLGGLYPALRAAGLSPVEALRHE